MPSLLDVLAQRFPDSSRTTLRSILQSGRVRVNDLPCRDARQEIVSADRVDVASRRDGRQLDPRVRVMYLDDDLVVIEKAVGLLTVPPENEPSRQDTAELILSRWLGDGSKRVHVVQRLDRDTSGVLVFARNGDMRDRLKSLFARHDIERLYIAIVHGSLDPPDGTIRSRLAEDDALRMQIVRDGEGKEAVTHYRTIEAGARFSRLEVTLETGRRNQIRVHLAERGHPIAGDAMYGIAGDRSLPRLALHARTLGFVHPRTRKHMTFLAPLPAEMERFPL